MSAAELDALAGQAEAIGLAAPGAAAAPGAPGAAGQPGQPGQAVAPDPTETNARVLATALALLRVVTSEQTWLFDPPLATPAALLTDARIAATVQPWAEVLTFYRWDLSTAFDHPLTKAAILTGPALWELASGIVNELRARNAKPLAPDSPDPGRGE